MAIWTSEIKELEKLYESFKGQLPGVEKELERLIKADDENMILLYSRRCLEVIITDLCECELKRDRGTEPLKGIIDKLNKDKKVPSHIITSMDHLNSLSAYGAHPKDFDSEQVKPVLNNLDIIIKWFLKHQGIDTKVKGEKIELRGESLEEINKETGISGKEKPAGSPKQKLLSGVLISTILVIAGILAYPKIFKRDKFEEIRDADGRISIAVMPFENLTGDTTLNWFQRGISSLIINGLGGSPELALRDDQTMFEVMESMNEIFTAGISPSRAKKVAEKVRAETYISGSFQGIGGKCRILTKLVDTKSGDIIWTSQVDGDLKSSEYLALTDSLCNKLKDYLEIRSLEQKADYDFREVFPNSAESYRYFIEGVNLILTSDYESAVKSLEKALEIDSTFTFASFYIAFAYSFGGIGTEQAKIWTQRAYKGKDRLPAKYQNWLGIWHAFYVSKNQQDIFRYCNLLEKSGIESRLLWLDLGATYIALELYDKADEALKKVEEISMERGSDWEYDKYYTQYSSALLKAGKPEEAKRIIEKGLQFNPNNVSLLIYKCSSNILLGDTIAAEKSISELIAWANKQNYTESTRQYGYGYIYLLGKDTIAAEKHWRKAYNLDPENPNRIYTLSEILLRSGINIKEGLELAEKGLKINPDNNDLLWMKGLAFHKLGKHEEALIILKGVDENSIAYNKELKKDIREVEQALASLKNN